MKLLTTRLVLNIQQIVWLQVWHLVALIMNDIVVKTSNYFSTIIVSAIQTTIITFAISIDLFATAIGIAIYVDMALAS